MDGNRMKIQQKFDEWMSDELTALQQWQVVTLMALQQWRATTQRMPSYNLQSCKLPRSFNVQKQQYFILFYFSSYLPPATSRVFKAPLVFERKREFYFFFKTSSAPRYIIPPFGLAFPISSNPGSIGW